MGKGGEMGRGGERGGGRRWGGEGGMRWWREEVEGGMRGGEG